MANGYESYEGNTFDMKDLTRWDSIIDGLVIEPDAEKIQATTIEIAKDLIRLLARLNPPTDIYADGDGGLCFEWYEGKDWLVDLSIDPERRPGSEKYALVIVTRLGKERATWWDAWDGALSSRLKEALSLWAAGP